MSSPAKRRKKNDHRASPQTVRSLDYFFGKQATKPSSQPQEFSSTTNSIANEPRLKFENVEKLTDEELAERLQAQWDQEDSLQKHEQSHNDVDGSTLEEALLPAEQMASTRQSSTLLGEDGDTEGSGNQNPENPGGGPSFFTGKTLSLQSNAQIEDDVSILLPLDESPLTFEPRKYLPDLKEQWQRDGGDATYALLTRCFVLVNSTQSRIKIVDTLVNLLRLLIEGDPGSLLPAVWLATNSISPPYISLELGLGGSAISKALKKVCGLDSQGLKTLYNKYGDAGDVAFEAKKRQSFTLRKPKPLSIKGVYQSLVKVANSRGNKSQDVKQSIVEKLIQDARGAEESRYIVRTLVQHVRGSHF
jgi:DNA ligase-1